MSDPLPPTERLYLLDTYHVSLPKGASVLAVLEEPDAEAPDQTRTAVVLDRTIFHPQGGGQPADQGRITLLLRRRDGDGDGDGDGASVEFVVDSVRDDGAGALKHYGAYVGDVVAGIGFEAGDEVALQVDEARRRLNARLHSAGHALDVAMARIGLGGECLKPTKGYHFPEGPYVEYEGDMPPQYAAEPTALVAALNAEMARLVEEGAATEVHVLPKPQASALLAGGEAELAHLPDDKDVRVVSVAGGGCPCGGTHVQSTSELGRVEVTKVKVTTKKRLVKVGYRLVEGEKEG